MNPFHISPDEHSPESSSLTHFLYRGSFEANKKKLPGFEWKPVESDSGICDFYDTHVWSLWYGNAILAHEGGWILSSNQELSRCEAFDGPAHFASDFPAGDFRSRLADLADIRAIRKTASVLLEREKWDISDSTGGTICRLSLCRIGTPRSRKIQTTLLEIAPLRGRKLACEALAQALMAVCRPTQVNLVQEAYRICKIRPVPYSLKPRLSFAPETHSRTVLLEIFTSLLSIARWNEEGIVKDIDTEFLHDFRVALRKLRSVAGQIKGVFPEALTLLWKNQIGDICRKTNTLRDYDVYLLSKDRLEEMLPEELRGGLEAFFNELRIERQAEAARVGEFLESDAYKSLIASFQDTWSAAHLIEPSPNSARPIREVAAERILNRFRRIRKTSRSITEETPDALIHSIRIDCKKMRYLLECFGHLLPEESVEPLSKQLARLQNRLGRYNDTAIQQDYLLQHAERHLESGDIRLALSLGGLIGSLHHEHAAMRDKVCEALEAFSKGANKKHATALTQPPAPNIL